MDKTGKGKTPPAGCEFHEMAFINERGKTGSARPKKIIKAGEIGCESDGVENTGSIPDEAPKIVPVMNAKLIEGLEIRCKCGEKLIIHFDDDERERLNN